MNYRYKRYQIFRKKLNVPDDVLERIYNGELSSREYIEYDLFDKIPFSCVKVSERRILFKISKKEVTLSEYVEHDLDGKVLSSCVCEKDRIILERFGFEKCRDLDWEAIDDSYGCSVNIRDALMAIDPNCENLNMSLYEAIKNHMSPKNYSKRMKEVYRDRLIEYDVDSYSYTKHYFNEGRLTLSEIIGEWDLFKDKDISLCLLNDEKNTYDVTMEEVRDFVDEFGPLAELVSSHRNLYEFISKVNSLEGEERFNYIKEFTDEVLSNTRRAYGDYRPALELSDEEYKLIFKYSSLEDYLMPIAEYYVPKIMEELKELPEDYIFNMPIPISVLNDRDVLAFISTYGLKNVVDFDNECGQFFTRDNCRMLKLMFDMYLHYAGNEHNPDRSIYTRNNYDENGNYVERRYTKDEFYEAMRRMIVYGPSDWNYYDKAPDYRSMTGEFRERFSELFVEENVPEELQQLFYTKSVTPRYLFEHPEHVKFLKGKDLSSCFKTREIEVNNENDKFYHYENLYNFVLERVGFDRTMQFVREYCDVFDVVFSRDFYSGFKFDIRLSKDDTIEEIENEFNEKLYLILLENNLPYPENVPDSFKEKYSNIFIRDDAPLELKELFYNRKISTKDILMNPSYIEFLKDVDLEFVFKYMPVQTEKGYYSNTVNLVSIISKVFGDDAFDVMLLYADYLEKLYKEDKLSGFNYHSKFSKESLLNELDKMIYQGIIEGKISYDDKLSKHFKDSYPSLFLDESVSEDIRNKFYNREFTLKDFLDNPDLIDLFGETNIVCGFSKNMAWMIPLFDNIENNKLSNYNRIKLLSAYMKIDDFTLQSAFREFVLTNKDLDIDKIEYAAEVLYRLSFSNSVEIFTYRKQLAGQVLAADDPLECLSKIEDIFIRSNIPTVGKVYSCFETLHPDFQGFSFNNSSVSPMLSGSSNMRRKVLVFSDLIKASFGSNNRSVNSYLDNIEIGSKLYNDIRDGKVSYESLSAKEKEDLTIFTKHLATLYNNTRRAKSENDVFICSGNVISDLDILTKKLSENGSVDYDLGDRVVRMFCGFAGINSLKEAKEYVLGKVSKADKRNREAALSNLVLEEGDFVKGIGDITYLRNILQNGSVAKEFLGASASSDSTPLDTDLSKIMNIEGSVGDIISKTAASSYGPIWFVLKNDDRFVTTRTHDGLTNEEKDRDKLEVFHTGTLGVGHYGIRTGFASSEINYIVMEKFDPRVALEIVMNGFYIPVANTKGEIIFTPEDYDMLRSKMSGLSYFGEDSYNFSSNLENDEVLELASQIEASNRETAEKREKINVVIREALDELGLKLKTEIDGDLTEGYVELIDTGSTARGTNKPGDGDFDMMMRLDRTIMLSPEKLGLLKKTILKKLGREDGAGVISTGDFRLKDVSLDECDVDIDITFTEKTDKVAYSTDMALQDRMETIKESDPEKYNLVVANILLAKQVLKEAGVYKPNRGEVPQGGLGGVGVENWILQNGGSFIDAARSFVDASKGKTFEEFKNSYYIWDFGDNHLAERRNAYVHDNFVANNMSEEGYHRMVDALTGYLKKHDKQNTASDSKKI